MLDFFQNFCVFRVIFLQKTKQNKTIKRLTDRPYSAGLLARKTGFFFFSFLFFFLALIPKIQVVTGFAK